MVSRAIDLEEKSIEQFMSAFISHYSESKLLIMH